jgi:hypothetical protein
MTIKWTREDVVRKFQEAMAPGDAPQSLSSAPQSVLQTMLDKGRAKSVAQSNPRETLRRVLNNGRSARTPRQG